MALAKYTRTSSENQVSRRQLLTAAPAAGLAALMAGATPVQAEADTPVMALFRKWRRAEADEQSAGLSGVSEDAYDLLADARRDIEQQMLRERAVSPVDVLAKIAAFTSFGMFMIGDDDPRTDQLWAECRAMMGGLV